MVPKVKEAIDIQEAMDNIAALGGIDLQNPPPIGIVKKKRIVTDEEEFPRNMVEWLSEEGAGPLFEALDATYRSIHQHLKSLYETPDMNWDNEKTKKGTAAMMALVGESADKLQAYLTLRLGKPPSPQVSEREEFKALKQFYTTRFERKFTNGVEGEAAWSEEWADNPEAALLDASKTGLKDFETVRRDAEYELFYLRNESGEPYFDAELLRNIKLSCDFVLEGETFEEDPLLKVRAMADRDLIASAGQILEDCETAIADFYKFADSETENGLVQQLGMGVLALLLAANPRYLLQNTAGKSCLEYFEDFHRFLRAAMKTSEYQKWIAYPPDKGDKKAYSLLFLTHALCKSFFKRRGGVKQEAIGLIHRTMRRGEELKQKEKKHLAKGETFWSQFQIDDEKMRSFLAQFPNGPLFKILDVIREEQDEDAIVPFDPIGQANLPSKLYDFERKGKKIEVLRLPSPTRQSYIHKVEIIDEFRGFLRALSASKPKEKLLIVNLQDRTSWKEYARSKALETLQFNAEFNHQVFVLTLPKSTDFYHQASEYLNMNKAEEFLRVFQEQLATPEVCGFFFPPQIKLADIASFVETALRTIHEQFFGKKSALTRRNREDFIEIFYQFLILKCIDLLEPTALSFTCKDAIDTGAAQAGLFYGFNKLLNEDLSDREDQDFLRWLFYAPALFVRERAIDSERLNRALSALERLSQR